MLIAQCSAKLLGNSVDSCSNEFIHLDESYSLHFVCCENKIARFVIKRNTI